MTRGEFEKALDKIALDYPFRHTVNYLKAHDAEQRRVIEGLSAKVKNLTAWSDRMFGTPCAEIRHQQQVEMLEEKIKQQAQEIARLENGLGCTRSHPHEDMSQICELRTEVARLKNELSQRTNLEGSAPCWNSAHMRQITTLREALDGMLFIFGHHEGYTQVQQAQQALKEVTS